MTPARLNDLLGQELGFNPFGEPIFAWKFSDDLFWPASYTGKSIEKTSPGGIIYFEREYKATPMSWRLVHQWVVCRWYPADALNDWQTRFPGADYPTRGYYIFTDWANKPDCPPTHEDTRLLIIQLKKQMGGMDYLSQLRTFEGIEDKNDAAKTSTLGDAIRDEFTAGLNPFPGKRGGPISWQTGTGDSPLLTKLSTTEVVKNA
jgi:hypothetical protein